MHGKNMSNKINEIVSLFTNTKFDKIENNCIIIHLADNETHIVKV